MKQHIISAACVLLTTAALAQREKDEYSAFAVKFTPTQLVMGEINFGFEHRVAPHSSLEVSLGPTISEIGGARLLTTDFEDLDAPAGNVETMSQMGYFASLGYRFYPLSYAKAPRGLYLSPEIKYRVYNVSYRDVMENLSDENGAVTETMFRFILGYHFWPGRRFSMDVYFGFGIGNFDRSRYTILETYNPDTMMNEYAWEEDKLTEARMNATFGLKFGIGN